MEELVVTGGTPLRGEVEVSGSKNVALKAVVAALLTDEEVVVEDVPLISDLKMMVKIARHLGANASLGEDHILKICAQKISRFQVPLEMGARLRTSVMVAGPLLSRFGEAVIPNPGGCRIGARPVDRQIEGLKALGAQISYSEKDGYFRAKAQRLSGTTYKFAKNTHTGTETLIMAAVLARGKTTLLNAAQEPEVDDLINLLNQMGAKIKRVKVRQIVIEGVKNLSGTNYKIMFDRNEAVTLGVAALVTGGDILVKNAQTKFLKSFLGKLKKAGGGWEPRNAGIRFFWQKPLKAVSVATAPNPGFMTDWQAPWTLLMTQAKGVSQIHETVYENRFQYVQELEKMGAKIEFFNPKVKNPTQVYNFNWEDNRPEYFHAVRVLGPTKLHNAVLNISDLRAGATLVLGALSALGESYISGVEHLDRGYENFEGRLKRLGAKIKRLKD